MSTRAPAIPRRRSRSVGRRRTITLVFVLAVVAALGYIAAITFQKGYRELALPLRHDDIIRQQARDKDLDPALIAAVIYRESRFRPRESAAGAQGLMQILPSTAKYIAHKSGGTAFKTRDLATPQINIAYGSWYLKYLLQTYDGDELTALAAYNAGEGRVNEWLRKSGKDGGKITDPDEIPFAETRAYVTDVLDTRDEYRRQYARELTL
ncbi:MAG: lytic transglycosylase domain-containing protein [Actinobacteria bacterium]|nr:lytic transglycosylase domain-containing protein [Actinomycetota bacterium]